MDDVNREKRELVEKLKSLRAELAELKGRGSAAAGNGERNREQFREWLDSLPEAVYEADSRHRITFVNEAALRMYGGTPESARGVDMLTGVIAEDRERLARNLARILRGEDVGWIEYTLLSRDGRRVPILAHSTAIVENGGAVGFRGMFVDMTRQKKSEEALRESEEKWRSLVENAPSIIMMVDEKGTLQFINHTVPGITPAEALGTSVYEYIPVEYHETMREAIEWVFRSGETTSFEIRGMGAGGRVSWYETQVGPVRRGEMIAAVMLIATDVSERKLAEARVTKAREEERRKLSSELHDDMGQLLAVAKMRVDGLRESRLTSTDVSTKELSTVSSILSNILEKTRDLSQRLCPPLLEQLGLSTAIKSLASQFESSMGIAVFVVTEGEERLPRDIDLLAYAIVQEALTNAARHSLASEVRVRISISDWKVEITVSDNGNGFDVDSLRSRTDCVGLRNMHWKVAENGGVFLVTSELSKGTTVYANLPL